MSMQIVISGNRVISYGTGFSVSGDTVENESTGKVYNNATIATVESVPDDIDSVGYEYHAGRFVPCAPYGRGDHNGYLMEACTDCATPRKTEIPTRWFKWESLATVSASVDSAEKIRSIQFPVDNLSDYAELRVIMKSGTIKNEFDKGNSVDIRTDDPRYSESISCFSAKCLPNEEIHYTDEVIYILHKYGYNAMEDFGGKMTIYVTPITIPDTGRTTFSMTLELQGRKE